jgi:hypothetical protein
MLNDLFAHELILLIFYLFVMHLNYSDIPLG